MRFLYFGRLRDCAEVEDVPPGINDVESLREWLASARPELVEQSVRMAVNDEMVVGNRLLSIDDEIAFLPPMSGG